MKKYFFMVYNFQWYCHSFCMGLGLSMHEVARAWLIPTTKHVIFACKIHMPWIDSPNMISLHEYEVFTIYLLVSEWYVLFMCNCDNSIQTCMLHKILSKSIFYMPGIIQAMKYESNIQESMLDIFSRKSLYARIISLKSRTFIDLNFL